MKLIYTIVLFFPIFCFSQHQPVTTTIDFVNGPYGDFNSCGSLSDCHLGTTGRTVSNVKFKATHGCPSLSQLVCCFEQVNRAYLTAFFGSDGHPIGTGMVLEYQFKAYHRYRITLNGSINEGVTLQMRMTNSPTYATNLCTFDSPPVDISSPANPLVFGSFISSSFDINYNSLVELNPDQCYSYLWFSSIPTTSSGGTTFIKSIKIEELNQLEIGGDITVCSGTSQYSLTRNGVPVAGAVSWVSSDPSVATISSTGNPATLTQVGDGIVTLTATLTGCGPLPVSITKNVAVGVLQAPTGLNFNGFVYTQQNAGSYCIGGEADYEVSVENAVLGANYWWTVSGADFRFGQGSNEAGITIGENPGGWLDISVQPENACGPGNPLTLAIPICGNGRKANMNVFTISPNPATNVMTVYQDKKNAKEPVSAAIEEIRIFDNIGNLKKHIKYPPITFQTNINVSELRSGVFFVEITSGKNKERHQVYIQNR
jgi:hypothetical protein